MIDLFVFTLYSIRMVKIAELILFMKYKDTYCISSEEWILNRSPLHSWYDIKSQFVVG